MESNSVSKKRLSLSLKRDQHQSIMYAELSKKAHSSKTNATKIRKSDGSILKNAVKKTVKAQKVEKRAGQRKIPRYHRAGSTQVMALIELQNASANRKRVAENVGPSDNEPPKKKARRFARCRKTEMHLCEVCSKEDCNECINCK